MFTYQQMPADSSEKTLANLLRSGQQELADLSNHQTYPFSSSSSSSSPSLSPSSTPPFFIAGSSGGHLPSSQQQSLPQSSSSDSSSPNDATRAVGQSANNDAVSSLKSYAIDAASGSSGQEPNGKSQLSRESIKSRLRSKHLKRTPSIRFVAKEDDGVEQQPSDPKLDFIVQMLMKGLKDDNEATAYSENLEKSVNERANSDYGTKMHLPLTEVGRSSAKVPKTYFDYSVDSGNAPLYIDVSVPVCVWVSYKKSVNLN